MAKNSALNIGIVAALALVATGCGHANMAVPQQLAARAAGMPTAVVQGVSRKFGYDYNKFETVGVKKANPKHLTRQGILRTQVDNRSSCSPVADQGQAGACTAFSMGKGLREQIEIKNGGDTKPVSPLFLYYAERELEGTTGEDSGAMISDGMKVLTETGICHESTWGYDLSNLFKKPTDAAYKEAGDLKIHDSTNLATLDDVKTALNAGQTVAFGFRVYASFRNVGADGMMPVPKPSEKVLGGHAVLAVGYDDEKQVLIVRNSWGASWADHGYFYMPYKVATNPSMVHEFYTASK